MKFFGACTENCDRNPELPRQNLGTDRNIINQTWHRWSGSGSCHVNDALENRELLADSLTHPCKTLNNTSHQQETPCKLIWFGNYLRPVAWRKKWQAWTCFLDNYSPTQDAKVTNKIWLSTPIHQRQPFLTMDQPLCLTYWRSDWRPRRYVKARQKKSRANNWNAWTITRVTRKNIEGWNSGLKRKHCNPELQHTLPREFWLWTDRSVSRTQSIHCPRFESWHSSAEDTTVLHSQIAQDELEQAGVIYQDVRKNTLQAYIKCKAYYYKKANASKLKELDYVIHRKTDHQGSKIPYI